MSERYSYEVTWSVEDGEYLGLCLEFPSLSWLAPMSDEALEGVRELVSDCVEEMRRNGEEAPRPQEMKREAYR
ncbi:MAG: antitoxin HicB [Acidobacteria bacterium]|nr:antitoxin HicB [Acidobacteriota bacterium]